MNPHDVMCPSPAGKGYSADDLAREQLKQADALLEAQLPALVALGTEIYLEKLRAEKSNTSLEEKLRATLAPDHAKRAREIFKARAEAILKAEATAEKQLAATAVAPQAPASVAAEARIQSEKRSNQRR